jgi:TusA-related sulfurtransferase
MSVSVERIAAESDAPANRPIERLDVRELGPPEPLAKTLERLEAMDGGVLVQINDRAPQHLYPKLDDRGYGYETLETEDATVTVIWE